AMTLEGAPHLKPDHLSVFDGLIPMGCFGIRRVTPMAQLMMQAAVEPFLSGTAAHTIALDPHASVEDMQKLMNAAWEMGVKKISLWRDGASLLNPSGIRLPAAGGDALPAPETGRVLS